MRGADISKASSSKTGYRPRPRSKASSAIAARRDSSRNTNRRALARTAPESRSFQIHEKCSAAKRHGGVHPSGKVGLTRAILEYELRGDQRWQAGNDTVAISRLLRISHENAISHSPRQVEPG